MKTTFPQLNEYKYKVTYLAYIMAVAFVRIADETILYANESEDNVRMYADGFCVARNEKYYIE